MVPGDVILKELDTQRSKWPLGIVQETCPSEDGLVRKVELRLGDTPLDKNGVRIKQQSILDRPVHKCVLLIPRDFFVGEPSHD